MGKTLAEGAKPWQAVGTKSSVLSDAAFKKLIGALRREISRDKDARFFARKFEEMYSYTDYCISTTITVMNYSDHKSRRQLSRLND